MSPILEVISAGPGASIQDGGRNGYLRYGVTGAGPMDPFAHALANRAVCNAADAAAMEISLGGIEVTVEGGAASLAVAGGTFSIRLDGRPLAAAATAAIEPGSRLSIRAGESGAWCYLAVAGGLLVPRVLGSMATHTRTGMGGMEGRHLRAGDRIPVSAAGPVRAVPGAISAPLLHRPVEVIRVMPGPQDDYFSSDQIAAFLAGPWTISSRGDRMAVFLDGPRLAHLQGYNITSDGIARGAIQVPGDGRPIVLMADRQSTGGYPKIATIIGADLGRFAQARPGSVIRFRAVSHAEAVAALAEERRFLQAEIPIEAQARTQFSSDFLLGLNLVSGCVDALARSETG